jgi:hypothetical protein
MYDSAPECRCCAWLSHLHLMLQVGCGCCGGCSLLLHARGGCCVACMPLFQQLLLSLGLRWAMHMTLVASC